MAFSTRFCLDGLSYRPKLEAGALLGLGMRLDANDMNRLAKCLWSVAAQEAEETQVAVAWLAHNLIKREGLSVEESCARVRLLWSDGVPHLDACREFDDRKFCRAFAILCQVWAGDRGDPTAGATNAHRHDESPVWAETASATALIGPWIFYRAN